MHRGWVKDWRKDEDWRWHPLNQKRRFTKYEAWKDLIKMANHETRRVPFAGKYRIVKRGQKLTSQVRLAERWKWARSSVNKFLKDLQSFGEVVVNVDTLSTLIIICNYDRYQSTADTGLNTDRTRVEHASNTDRHKQELKELEELKNTTTTGDFVKFFVEKSADRFRQFNIDTDKAIADITAYAITHSVSKDEIGPLVYRWPELRQQPRNPAKSKKKGKDYGKPGITSV